MWNSTINQSFIIYPSNYDITLKNISVQQALSKLFIWILNGRYEIQFYNICGNTFGASLVKDFKINSICTVYKTYFTTLRRSRISQNFWNHHRKPNALKPQFCLCLQTKSFGIANSISKFIYSEYAFTDVEKHLGI